MRHLRRYPELRWGVALVGALLLVAIAAPLLAPYDPDEQFDPAAASYRPPGTTLTAIHLRSGPWLLADRVERSNGGLRITRAGRTSVLPTTDVANLNASGVTDRRTFHLGSDGFGRDLLSRILFGARLSLGIAAGVVVLALLLGVLIGAAAALGGPFTDLVLMRLVEALITFPPLFLLIALSAFLHPGIVPLLFILAALSWTAIARVMRAELLRLRQEDFILAARASGQTPTAILVRHLLPNALPPVLVQATLLPGTLIALEASLSFLGLGLQPPAASWGNLIAEGQSVLLEAWWVTVFPGIMLALTVIAFNLLGEGLRDALAPPGLAAGTGAATLAPPA
jgi:peptide/nickel transport system permease protein